MIEDRLIPKAKSLVNMKKSLTVFLLAVLLGQLFSCNGTGEKVKALNHIVSQSIFADTSLTYILSSDSLVIEFAKPPKIKHWYGELFLIKANGKDEIYIPFPNVTKEKLGYLTLKSNKMVFTHHHIPQDSLSKYSINFHFVPHHLGCHSSGEIYVPGYLFQSIGSTSTKLSLNKMVNDFKVVTVDLVKLKNMSTELQDYCLDSIERAYGITISDLQIEHAKYAF